MKNPQKEVGGKVHFFVNTALNLEKLTDLNSSKEERNQTQKP